MKFIKDQNIEFIHLGKELSDSWETLDENVVLEALHIILNVTNYPLLIMDILGRHITGTVVGCLRKVQKWKLTSIFQEYRRYAGIKVYFFYNKKFIFIGWCK